MKKLITRITAIAFMATALFAMSCSDDESKPSKPSIDAPSEYSVSAGEERTFDIQVSAAGKISDVSATVDKGNVSVINVTGINDFSGTATLKYTAPSSASGEAKITVTAKDNANQTKSAEVSITEAEVTEVEGTLDANTVWGPNETIRVTGNIIVPEGGKLTVREGTTVLVNEGYTINVRGNFYSTGTAENPILFTLPKNLRTKANIFEGKWGGILASSTTITTEMVVLYTRIEFVGLAGAAGTDIVDIGEVEEGDPTYALFFNNPTGKCVIQHSTFTYSKDVAVQINQGNIIVTNNTFILNGEAGGEAIDIKAGTHGDIAFNVFYKTATNAVKFNSKDQDESRTQTDIHIYNNTIVESGWRQESHSDHGGSLNAEAGTKGSIYNNIFVNCVHGTRFTIGSKGPDVANLKVGYSLFYGNSADIVAEFYPTIGSIKNGAGDYETASDVVSTTVGANDPLFVNFNVTTFNATNAAAGTDVDLIATFPDFHLQATSPAISKGKTTSFAPYFSAGLTVNGQTYNTPTPASYIGALGVSE